MDICCHVTVATILKACPNPTSMDAQQSVFEVTRQSFQTDVIERSRSMPVVLLFWTDQVAPSVDTRNTMERLVQQYQGKFSLGLSDVTQDQVIARELRIQAVPSIRVIVNGGVAEQMDGPQGESALRTMLDRLTMSSGEQLQASLDEVVEREDWDTAMAILQQALNDEPNNPKFKIEWADVLLHKGEPEEARKVLDTISEDEPERQRPATRLELHEEAAAMRPLQEVAKAIEMSPEDLDSRYEIAVLLAVQRDYEHALEHLMFILQKDRKFRDDIGRETMVRIMSLMGKNSPIAKQYRRRMFNFMH